MRYRLYLLHVVFVVSPFQSHHHTHTMLLMGYVEFRADVKDAGKVAVKVDSTPQTLTGDITHATYSCGLDCEKQEHWNRARKSLHIVSCWTKITQCEASGNLISAFYQAST